MAPEVAPQVQETFLQRISNIVNEMTTNKSAYGNDLYGIPIDTYKTILSDGIVTPEEKRILYENYYTPSPAYFIGSGTNFGSKSVAVNTIFTYGGYIRQQMIRGWVLEASGMYGYHDDLLDELQNFHFIYTTKDRTDILLSKQASTLYSYFADQHPGANGEPTPVTYDQLNSNQKRLYDLTNVGPDRFYSEKLTSIDVQSKMTPEEALASGKYIGIVATKSVNDLGRRFLLYKYNETTGTTDFVGVVVVGDFAKRDDWIGSGSPTQQANADFYNFPLGTRVQKGYQWGIDLTQDLYEYFGGTGGPVFGVVLVDPDANGFSSP